MGHLFSAIFGWYDAEKRALKGPGAPLIAGFGAWIGSIFNFDDIFSVRLIFFIISCFAAAGLYFLGLALFESWRVGLLSSLTFIAFWGFGRFATSGPRAKTPMVLFEILALIFAYHRNWFLSGAAAFLSLLVWQPSGIFLIVIALLSIFQSGKGLQRLRGIALFMGGALAPGLLVLLYFIFHGAINEFLDGFLFAFTHLERSQKSLFNHFYRPIYAIFRGFWVMSIPIILGLYEIILLFSLRLKKFGNDVFLWLREDRLAAFLIAFPLIIIWSLIDFQDFPDFFIFLPYAAIGFALVLDKYLRKKFVADAAKKAFVIVCVLLIVVSFFVYRFTAEEGLSKQRKWAAKIDKELIKDRNFASIGVPEILVLLKRTNPNPFIVINGGIDQYIDSITPKGFSGWLNELEQYNPSVIAFGRTKGRLKPAITSWLGKNYQEKKVGRWVLFVKP